MDISNLLHQAGQKLKSNAPEILTALGVTGVVSTAILAAKASSKVAKDEDADPWMNNKEKIRKYWKIYVPTGLSGAFTITCIIAGSKASGRRTAAAVTAYSLTERAFSEYKEKVIEQVGKGKEQKVRDEMAQDRVTANPPTKEVIIAGAGEVLCCELYTKRYLKSSMERLQQAKNEINHRINNDMMYVCLDEFYDLIDLSYTSNSSRLGWDSDKLMELEFSTVLTPDNEPCLAFDYNYVKPLK